MKSILKNPPAYVIIFALIPSATTVIWVRLAAEAPGLAVSFWRMVFSLILCLPLLYLERGQIKYLTKKELLICALSGFFLALHFATWLSAINLTTVAAAASLVTTAPIWVAIINAVLFRKKPTKIVIISLISTIAGSVIIAFGGGNEASLGNLDGNILALFGAISVAGYLIAGNYVRKTVGPGIYVTITFAIATIFLAIFTFALRVPFTPYAPNTFLAIFAMAFFCSIGGHVVFSWLVKYHGAMFISLAVLSEPILASIYAFFLFDETPPLATILGGAMIIAGLAYYIKKEQTQA